MFRVLFIMFLCLSVRGESFHKQFIGQKTVFGKTLTEKDIGGKVLLIDYWGMNCSPCVAGMPKLQKLYQKFKSSGKFEVIASHVAFGDTKKIQAFLKTKKYSFKALRYFHLKENGKMINVRSLPYMFLIDHKGKIIKQGVHLQNLEKDIARLIKDSQDD